MWCTLFPADTVIPMIEQTLPIINRTPRQWVRTKGQPKPGWWWDGWKYRSVNPAAPYPVSRKRTVRKVSRIVGFFCILVGFPTTVASIELFVGSGFSYRFLITLLFGIALMFVGVKMLNSTTRAKNRTKGKGPKYT